MVYSFKAYGHKNILSLHKNTLEFTKDKELTLRGDCIVGVNSDFSLENIKEFIKSLKNDKIKIIIRVDNLKEEVNATINKNFNSEHEMVIRKSDFTDARTFAIRADKSSRDLDWELVKKLTSESCIISIKIEDC